MTARRTRARALPSNVVVLPVPLRRVTLADYGKEPDPDAVSATIVPFPLRFFPSEVQEKVAAIRLGETLLRCHAPGSRKYAEVNALLDRLAQEVWHLVRHGPSRPFRNPCDPVPKEPLIRVPLPPHPKRPRPGR